MPCGWGRDHLWSIQTMQCYSALKNMSFQVTQTWRKCKCILQSGRSQSEEATSCMIATLTFWIRLNYRDSKRWGWARVWGLGWWMQRAQQRCSMWHYGGGYPSWRTPPRQSPDGAWIALYQFTDCYNRIPLKQDAVSRREVGVGALRVCESALYFLLRFSLKLKLF